ncbi:MAG: hypothetical protein JWM35_2231, partial [Verrucomicrobia bacterium]|nr:hypothetical protein [Verrucomicrobiota bacterium]
MSLAVEIAQALVRIPSVNPHYDPASDGEGGAVRWIERWARWHGIESRIDEVLPGRSNIILSVNNGAEHPHFLMAGHTDTVAVDGMEVAPFGGEISNGRLSGRGSADMKGPLAAMLAALLTLRDQRERWRGSATVACVVDEEYQARGIKALMARPDSRFSYAVVGEPTRMSVVRGCKGCLRFSFDAVGASAHSSTPDLGRNAIVAMSEAILALNTYFHTQLNKEYKLGFGSATGSIGLIRGGSGINIVPETCRASVDIRLVPGQRWEAIYAQIKACVENRVALVPGVSWKFDEAPFTDPSFETAEGDFLVRTSLGILGQRQAEVVAYSCDASKIAAAGVPTIILGPGDIARAHTSTE